MVPILIRHLETSDLKSRGLLAETLVIVGEFGRTPVVENSGMVQVQNGRDLNSYGSACSWPVGGMKGGMIYGATDDFGFKAVEAVHVHDLHATILHLLGLAKLDRTRLTYRHMEEIFD